MKNAINLRDKNFTLPKKYAAGGLKRGGISSKIWVKKLSLREAFLLLEFAQVFSRGEGRIGGPNLPYSALGSPQKNSHNLSV